MRNPVQGVREVCCIAQDRGGGVGGLLEEELVHCGMGMLKGKTAVKDDYVMGRGRREGRWRLKCWKGVID